MLGIKGIKSTDRTIRECNSDGMLDRSVRDVDPAELVTSGKLLGELKCRSKELIFDAEMDV